MVNQFKSIYPRVSIHPTPEVGLAQLVKDGFEVVHSIDQQGTIVGRELRKINLEHEDVQIAPLTEALIIAAARHQNVFEVIKPGLNRGQVVIGERFNDAFFAFQYSGRGLPIKIVEDLSEMVADGIEVKLTILLDVDPGIALERINLSSRHRIEKESLEFHRKVREGYLTLAEKYPERIKIMDANKPIEEVFTEVWEEVKKVIYE
ncbi:dTMP kinase [Candidatus Woesebacteria bacterium RIFCSPHIGHO2_01_FULL_38_10]|uniref:Thymidylate kinase n=1 Tax=Candidatus Woesebacteria bacterium RIFCSPLOWO2_01_FULL_39_10b TaxID=1802517 RepID=A0A1F8BAL8_9BACT|nr:MAG: dTMP kinase [Candidatus Woesebacteria bacterium RIFCSPHIGHO2_01_FULL_38_10]OGM60408.1 MAG: dTMP kinase [Candidatus Woesebacteria bacterium RIFCSPLOWO2_01_FULL_39_10b]